MIRYLIGGRDFAMCGTSDDSDGDGVHANGESEDESMEGGEESDAEDGDERGGRRQRLNRGGWISRGGDRMMAARQCILEDLVDEIEAKAEDSANDNRNAGDRERTSDKSDKREEPPRDGRRRGAAFLPFTDAREIVRELYLK